MHSVIWLILAVGLFIFEGVTVQLVSIWFGIAAVAASIAAVCGVDLIGQLMVFVCVSVILLAITRPLVRKKLRTKQVATNADQVINCIVTVKSDFDDTNKGRIRVNNLDWSSHCKEDQIIKAGDKVCVKSIEGVTLIVERVST